MVWTSDLFFFRLRWPKAIFEENLIRKLPIYNEEVPLHRSAGARKWSLVMAMAMSPILQIHEILQNFQKFPFNNSTKFGKKLLNDLLNVAVLWAKSVSIQ